MPTITDTITTSDGTCPVTLATPDGEGPWPGIVLYPDAAGRRPVMEEMAAPVSNSALIGLPLIITVPTVNGDRRLSPASIGKSATVCPLAQ